MFSVLLAGVFLTWKEYPAASAASVVPPLCPFFGLRPLRIIESVNGFSHKSSALRVAAYFNPANKTWIARHKRIVRVGTEQIRKQDNYYGYGSQLIEAIEGVVQQIGVHGRNVFCRVILPDKHLARLRVDFSGTV